MDQQKLHGFEKIQVQVATVAALAVAYFGTYHLLAPGDPDSPLTFIIGGNMGQLWELAGFIALLAAALGVLTVSARIEGVLTAVLVGTGGAAMRSQPFDALLRLNQDNIAGLYGRLIGEMLLLTCMAIMAGAIIVAARLIVSFIRPGWLWRSRISSDETSAGSPSRLRLAVGNIADHFTQSRQQGKAQAGILLPSEKFKRSMLTILLALVISGVLVFTLMQSQERGQVIFAIFAGMLLGALAAHQIFPSPLGLLVWLPAVIISTILYLYGGSTILDATVQAWIKVPLYCRSLPIDWITFGIGGAYLGYWISLRLTEMNSFETQPQTNEEE